MVDLQQAEEILNVLVQQRKDCLRRLADLQYVLTNQDEFVWEGEHAPQEKVVAELNEASRMFSQRLAKIQRAASSVAASLAPVDITAELGDMPAWSLPARPQLKEPPPPPPPEPPPDAPGPRRIPRGRLLGTDVMRDPSAGGSP